MADDLWHTQGNWAPVLDELDVSKLTIRGELPKNLNGTFIRTGPNPAHETPPHWFLGDGMVHGIRLEGGKAKWYRNAFIKTDILAAKGDRGGGFDLRFGTGNTSVHHHNGKVLTLLESAWPWRINEDLETLGVENFDGDLSCSMTAHPKICPETGELLAFSYFQFEQPFLRYIRIGADGQVKQIEPIELPNMVMMHDFAITRNFVIFLDLPLVFKLEALSTGMPFQFDRSADARIGIMPRDGTNADVKWYDINPCYIFHTVNAHEQGSKIVLTASRLNSTMESTNQDYSQNAFLWRWVIDLETGQVSENQLDDRASDFGRINDAFIGQPARYGYLMGLGGDGKDPAPVYGNHLYKYDLESAGCKVHRLGDDSVHWGRTGFRSNRSSRRRGLHHDDCA